MNSWVACGNALHDTRSGNARNTLHDTRSDDSEVVKKKRKLIRNCKREYPEKLEINDPNDK